jgi:hypothetical protein
MGNIHNNRDTQLLINSESKAKGLFTSNSSHYLANMHQQRPRFYT